MAISDATVVRAGIEAAASEMHTATVAEIVTYNPATQRATVRVAVTKPLTDAMGNVSYEDLGSIAEVPVLFPRTKNYSIVFPLDPGDTVLLVYMETSIGEWRQGSKLADPGDTGRHSNRYPVAIPGIFPDLSPALNTAPNPMNMVLGRETGTSKVIIAPTQIQLGLGATVPIAMSSKTDAALAAIQSKLDSIISTYNTHTHALTSIPVTNATPAGPGPVTAAGTTAVPSATGTPVGTQPTTASILVKSL